MHPSSSRTKGQELPVVIQHLEGHHGQIGFFQHLGLGVDRQELVRWQVQALFQTDDIVGGQGDLDTAAALGKTGNFLMAGKPEGGVDSQPYRLDVGHLVLFGHFDSSS
jgi:hypothetical protein